MKKVLIICIALVAIMFSFSGCSVNDRAVKIGAAMHDVGKAAYTVGGGLLNEPAQKVLEKTSEGLDDYGDKRKILRDLQDETNE